MPSPPGSPPRNGGATGSTASPTSTRPTAPPPAPRHRTSTRPLLALEENPPPLTGYPAIVLKAKPQLDGAVRLSFAARLSLPAFDAVAKFQIGQQDADALRLQQLRPEQVKIEPWPISHAIVD